MDLRQDRCLQVSRVILDVSGHPHGTQLSPLKSCPIDGNVTAPGIWHLHRNPLRGVISLELNSPLLPSFCAQEWVLNPCRSDKNSCILLQALASFYWYYWGSKTAKEDLWQNFLKKRSADENRLHAGKLSQRQGKGHKPGKLAQSLQLFKICKRMWIDDAVIAVCRYGEYLYELWGYRTFCLSAKGLLGTSTRS